MTHTPQHHAPPTLDVDQAAAAIDAGGVVAIPTETVVGLFAAANNQRAQATLRDLGVASPDAALAWHVPSGQRVLEIAAARWAARSTRDLPSTLRRLVHVLAPGPVMFGLELAGAEPPPAPDHPPPGIADAEGRLLVRATDHPLATAVLARAAAPVVAAGTTGRTIADALAPLAAPAGAPGQAAPAIAGALEGPPTPAGGRSTLVHIDRSGAWRVAREGALPARVVERRFRRTILFVCTGNTCRSPMAAALARHALEHADAGDHTVPTAVRSAGTFATPGAPATAEAAQAVESLGVPFPHHAATPLTRELIDEADAIYCFTAAHRDAVLAFEPAAEPRTALLDPEGGDVPDPVGHPQHVYNATAARIADLLARRLDQLDA